jgi:ParB-like chromosome segregation protein Spo0J
MNVPVGAIDVPAAMLAYDATRTVKIAAAIRAGKVIEPLTVVKKCGRYVLVKGKDEFAAWKLVGAETAPVRVVDDIRLTWRERRLLGRKAQ